MASLSLNKGLIRMLNFFEGDTAEKKVINLVNGNALLKLKECEDEIVRYESKYGMTFADFKKAWDKGTKKEKYAHEVERDFMEWEGFEGEKKHWLSALKEIRVKFYSKR